ncbi:MAG: hypothetical protein EBV28_02550 [Betaproteobacteria bacterium]|nr:hypothetical protein [Betaproteobacteria bacterium]
MIKAQAGANGLDVKGQSEWLLNDTNFSNQVREIKRAGADVVAISAHPFTTCGVLKEMARQNVKPKLLIGLTSSSSMETLQGCGVQAEGLIIPTATGPSPTRRPSDDPGACPPAAAGVRAPLIRPARCALPTQRLGDGPP